MFPFRPRAPLRNATIARGVMAARLRHRFAVLVCFVLGLTGPTAAITAAEPSKKPTAPNIVVILADDLGWMDLGCYGSTFHQTPNLDRLAREGLRFRQGYAACAVCSPTRASVLTGRNPARLHLTDYIPGVRPADSRLVTPDWRPYLGPEILTLPQALRRAGYTSALVGKWHLGGAAEWNSPPESFDSTPERRGFDVNIAGNHYGQPPDYFFPYERAGPNGTTYRFPNPPPGRAGDYLTDRLTDAAIGFIEQNRQKPFFLYLPHYAVHTSIGNRLQAESATIAKYQSRVDPKSPQHNAVYAAMVDNLDANVGRLLARLDELGLSDRTLVWFTSDNGGYGQMTSQAPLRGAKSEPYEGGLRVPHILRLPGVIPAGQVSDVPVHSDDIFPTCCALAGVRLVPPGSAAATPQNTAPREAVDGVSLLPLFQPGGKLERTALYWHYPHYNASAKPYGVVRRGDDKLIEHFEDGSVELYDLAADPGERRDLSVERRDRAEALRRELATWRTQVDAQIPRPRH